MWGGWNGTWLQCRRVKRARMRHRKAFASFTLVSCLCIRFHAWPHSGCSKRRRNRVDPYIRTKSTEIRMLRHLLTLCRCKLSVLLEIEFDYLLEFFEKFLLIDSFDIISIVNLYNIFFDLIIMIFFDQQIIEDWFGCEK